MFYPKVTGFSLHLREDHMSTPYRQDPPPYTKWMDLWCYHGNRNYAELMGQNDRIHFAAVPSYQ